MTNEEILEIAQTAHAQASAAQGALLALIHTLRGNVLSDKILSDAFELAAETYVTGSYSADKAMAAHATRVLQAIEHMRRTTIGK